MLDKKYIEVALKALYSKERTLQNSFHAMYRSLENAKTYKELNMNIENILKRIDTRQAELLEVTTAIYHFETYLEDMEESK
jgi:chaperonin cofactor prefoldin